MNNGFASVYCYYWSPLGDSLSEPYSSDQCTHACVNDYLSARARGEYCSGFPGRRAEATARLEDKAHAAGSLIAARKECVVALNIGYCNCNVHPVKGV